MTGKSGIVRVRSNKAVKAGRIAGGSGCGRPESWQSSNACTGELTPDCADTNPECL